MRIIKDWLYNICYDACQRTIREEMWKNVETTACLAQLIIDVGQGKTSMTSYKFLQRMNISPDCLTNNNTKNENNTTNNN